MGGHLEKLPRSKFSLVEKLEASIDVVYTQAHQKMVKCHNRTNEDEI
jgi:hypothetical protein